MHTKAAEPRHRMLLAYFLPSLISLPFRYHFTLAFSLESWQEKTASSNSVTVWSSRCSTNSVGASMMSSSATDLSCPAVTMYSPSSGNPQSLMIRECLYLSIRYDTRLSKATSSPFLVHLSVTLRRFTLHQKVTDFFSIVSMSLRGSIILRSSSVVVENNNVEFSCLHNINGWKKFSGTI